jgi:hypothetical protein
MSQKTITESRLSALNVALNESLEIDRLEKEIAKRKEENRAKLLELGQSLVDDENRTAAPGFEIRQNIEVVYDETASLIYALRDDVFPGAAGLLSLHKDAVGVLIGMCLRVEALKETAPEIASQFPDLRRLFIVDKSGYAKAVREGRYNDMPYLRKETKLTVAVSAKSVKTGDELAKEFVIVPDEPAQEAATETTAETV